MPYKVYYIKSLPTWSILPIEFAGTTQCTRAVSNALNAGEIDIPVDQYFPGNLGDRLSAFAGGQQWANENGQRSGYTIIPINPVFIPRTGK